MKELLKQYTGLIIVFICCGGVLAVIFSSKVIGFSNNYSAFGNKLANTLHLDGYMRPSCGYADSMYCSAKPPSYPIITMKTSIKAGIGYKWDDVFSSKEGSNNLNVVLCSIKEYATSQDATNIGSAVIDVKSKTFTIKKCGTYRIKVRSGGSTVTRKSFIVAVCH